MSEAFEIVKTGIDFFCNHLVFFNMLFAIVIVFFQRRDPKSVWAWLLLLYFIPVLGFVFYLLLGQDMHKRKMFRIKEVEDHISKDIRQQEYRLRSRDVQELDENIRGYEDLVMYNLEAGEAMLTKDNDVDIFIDGNEKFRALMEDLRNAEHFIHIQYYIIKNDVLFNQIKDILIEKAAQGVEVRVLFDAMGCRSVRHSYWKWLNEKGVQTAEFFPAILRRLQIRINYRNHRKIVVVDNKVAYVGGFNVGKEYIDLDEKFGHWRDTHLRITGEAVMSLQIRFALDWNYATGENLFKNEAYFRTDLKKKTDVRRDKERPAWPDPELEGSQVGMQIIASGPDTREPHIRNNYLELFHKAKHHIYIQTPYFVPDDAIFSALKMAALSGVDVRLMIPCKPDHPFVYRATCSYAGELLDYGAKVYIYTNGFLHSKGIMVDGRVCCYGTANMDIRSFELNFEVNATIYDEAVTAEVEQAFMNDLPHCRQITREDYKKRGLLTRIREQGSRLLSPLL